MSLENTGVDFNFSFAPGVTDEQILGFELAGEMWSQHLGDTHMKVEEGKDFTVNIHVEVTDDLLPDNVLGGAFPAIETGKRYKDFYKAAVKDASTLNDQKIVDSLLDTDKVDVLVGDRVVGNDHMQMTRANMKALDLVKADDKELDGYIVINDLSNLSNIEWNYDYLGGAKPGTIDFLSTATHEIGHVMGFISGTDRTKSANQFVQNYANSSSNNFIQQFLSIQNTGGYYVELNNGSNTTEIANNQRDWVEFKAYYQEQDLQRVTEAIQTLQNLEDYNSRDQARHALNTIKDFLKRDHDLERLIKDDDDFKEVLDNLADVKDSQSYSKFMTSMDLFRYSEESANLGINDLSIGNDTYFSLDGSQTGLGLSKGTLYDYQGSHWENREHGNGLGVMNPTIALNERWEISENDLLVMDAIGWDVVNPGTIDFQAVYDNAVVQVQTAVVEDRNKDVKDLLDSDAYNWSRRSSSSSFWQEGYFSTLEIEEDSTTCDSDCREDNPNKNDLFIAEDIVKKKVSVTDTKDLLPQDSNNNNLFPENKAEKMSRLNQADNNDNMTQKPQDKSKFSLDRLLVDTLLDGLGTSL